MLNDVLHNLEAHTKNGYCVCVCLLCVLENDGVSECYTGKVSYAVTGGGRVRRRPESGVEVELFTL